MVCHAEECGKYRCISQNTGGIFHGIFVDHVLDPKLLSSFAKFARVQSKLLHQSSILSSIGHIHKSMDIGNSPKTVSGSNEVVYTC